MSQPITNISFDGDKIQSLLFFIIIFYHRLTKMVASYALGKRPLGRPRRRWEDNIRMNLGLIRLRIGIIKEPV